MSLVADDTRKGGIMESKIVMRFINNSNRVYNGYGKCYFISNSNHVLKGNSGK